MIRTIAAMAVALLLLAGADARAARAASPASPTARKAAVAPLLSTPQFRRYEVADGLPGSAVNALAQDSRGVMWFGGAGGLASYDGTDFKQYLHSASDPNSLATRDVTQVVPGLDGAIWVSGDAGLDRLDPVTGRSRHWRHDPHNAGSLASNSVYAITQTAGGRMWVGTDDGLDLLDPRTGRAQHIAYRQGPDADGGGTPDRIVNALLAEKDGTLWFGTMAGELIKRLPDGRLQRISLPTPAGQLNQIWRIEGGGADLRVATRLGLYLVAADGSAKLAIRADQLKPGYVFASARDDAGRLWLATLHGVAMLEPSGTLRSFHSQPLLRGGLPGEWIWRVMKDREGGMWFSFHDGGVAYLPPQWDRFSRFTHVPDDPTSLHDTIATTVAAGSDGQLWVGGRGQIDRLDPATGQVEHVVTGLPSDVISMASDGRTLWFTIRGRLQAYRGGKMLSVDPRHRVVVNPKLVLADGQGNAYVTTARDGLVKVDGRTLTPVPVAMPADAENVSVNVSGLDYSKGTVWFSNHQGLMRWYAALGRMAFVPGVPQGEINAFALEPGGLWLARKDTLEHYVAAGRGFRRDRVFGTAQGWTGAVVTGFVTDAQQRLWIFSSNGLTRLDLGSGQFSAFGPQDGLLSAEFIGSPVVLGKDVFLAPSQEGVIGFDAQRQLVLSPPPDVEIPTVEVRGRAGLLPIKVVGHELRLGWRERDILLKARAYSYINPAANRYQFDIGGLDTQWIDRGNSGDREIFSLSPGRYRVRVRVENGYGQWGHLVVPLVIDVQAPPWTRWWAWLAYAAAAALLLWLGARVWRSRLAQRHCMQLAEQQRVLAEQASAAKSEFLATLSHEIRTPMTGVIGMAELLLGTPLQARQREYGHSIHRSGQMLLKLLNDALDLARIEAGRLELEPTPFDPRQLLADVAGMIHGQAQAKDIDFTLELAPDLPAAVMGDAVRIKQVLINLGHNAIKFTERGRVTLDARTDATGLVFAISDTGPGMAETSQARLFERFEQADGPQRRAGCGLGLAICRELVEKMGGSIELQSQPGQGSTFRVRLALEPCNAPAAEAAGEFAADTADSHYRVLLVEDDETVAAVIRGLLQQRGHAVTHVAHGLAALAEVVHAEVDVMLLDLDLPGVDGLQVARLVRQREAAGVHLPIVAITARAGGQEEAQTRAAGMDGFLRKPVTGAQLQEAIAAVTTPLLEAVGD